MMLRRTLEGALKCALRDLRRLEETAVQLSAFRYSSIRWLMATVVLTGADLDHFD